MTRQISQFLGMQVMFCDDINSPPHLHVHYGTKQGVLGVDSVMITPANAGGAAVLPPRVVALATEWIMQNRDALVKNWEIYKVGGTNLIDIPPLVE